MMKIKHCFQTLGTFSHAITSDSPCHPGRDMYDIMHLRNQAPIRIQLGKSAEELLNLHFEVLTFVLGGDRGENVIQNCEQIEVISPLIISLRNKVTNQEGKKTAKTPGLGS